MLKCHFCESRRLSAQTGPYSIEILSQYGSVECISFFDTSLNENVIDNCFIKQPDKQLVCGPLGFLRKTSHVH